MRRRVFGGVEGRPFEVWEGYGRVSDRLDHRWTCRAIYASVEEECPTFRSCADAVDRSFGHDGRFETRVLFCEGETPEQGRENGTAMGWTHLEQFGVYNNGCSEDDRDGRCIGSLYLMELTFWRMTSRD
jgi:hypothetical protein